MAKKPSASAAHVETVIALMAAAFAAVTNKATELVHGDDATDLRKGQPITVLSVGEGTSLATAIVSGELEAGSIDNNDYDAV